MMLSCVYARTGADMTQRQLAEASGIAFPHVSRLEKGTHLPSVATLKKVSDALKVPICSLLDPPTVEKPKPRTRRKK
jgi:transcriptional regulator with XRE-family HTH domain